MDFTGDFSNKINYNTHHNYDPHLAMSSYANSYAHENPMCGTATTSSTNFYNNSSCLNIDTSQASNDTAYLANQTNFNNLTCSKKASIESSFNQNATTGYFPGQYNQATASYPNYLGFAQSDTFAKAQNYAENETASSKCSTNTFSTYYNPASTSWPSTTTQSYFYSNTNPGSTFTSPDSLHLSNSSESSSTITQASYKAPPIDLSSYPAQPQNFQRDSAAENTYWHQSASAANLQNTQQQPVNAYPNFNLTSDYQNKAQNFAKTQPENAQFSLDISDTIIEAATSSKKNIDSSTHTNSEVKSSNEMYAYSSDKSVSFSALKLEKHDSPSIHHKSKHVSKVSKKMVHKKPNNHSVENAKRMTLSGKELASATTTRSTHFVSATSGEKSISIKDKYKSYVDTEIRNANFVKKRQKSLIDEIRLVISRKRESIKDICLSNGLPTEQIAYSIKQHLYELTKNLVSHIIKNIQADLVSANLDFSKSFMDKSLFTAYACLIDNSENMRHICDVDNRSNYLRLSLKNMYKKFDKTNTVQTSPSQNYHANELQPKPIAHYAHSYSNPYFSDHHPIKHESQLIDSNPLSSLTNQVAQFPFTYNSTTTTSTCDNSTLAWNTDTSGSKICCSVDELKMLHFLLLLFTQILNIDEPTIGNHLISSAKASDTETVGPMCVRIVTQLIDQLCQDKSLKVKILLTVSEM